MCARRPRPVRRRFHIHWSLPKVAVAAGVSVPTVYRHFPTTEDLLAAFLAWLRPQVGQTHERLLSGATADIARLPLENFPRFEAHKAVLLPLMDSPVFHKVRIAAGPNTRKQEAAARLRTVAPKWSDADLEAASGAVYALVGTQAWRWMRETWDLDAEDAARASSWAVSVLLDALAAQPGMVPRRAAKKRTAKKRTQRRGVKA